MSTVKSYFPRRAVPRPDLALLRRRGDERGRPAGRLAARIWTRSRLTSGRCARASRRATRSLAGELQPEQRDAFLGQALAASPAHANDPPPAKFRLIVSPMVISIWIGALIACLGGLIAFWPPPRGARSRASAGAYAARSAARSASRPEPERSWTSCSLVVVALIALLVSAPLRRRGALEERRAPSGAELESAPTRIPRDRDAELDLRTGKLSDADWRAQDRAPRAEAVDILRRLDELGSRGLSETGSWSVRRRVSAAATCR